MTLFTIGCTRKSLESFVRLIRDAGVDALIDIRLNNTSQLAGLAKKDDLSFIITEFLRIPYHHVLELAPSPEMLEAYRSDKDWAAYDYSLPHSLESYYQAGRAGRDGGMSRCILLSSPSDKANLTRWMRSERISVNDLRDTYKAIGHYVPAKGCAPVHEDDLQRDTGLDETKVRVAISLLEEAGLLTRYNDLPMMMAIDLLSAASGRADQEFLDFIGKARLRVSQRLAISATELAERSGIPAVELEAKLLEWRDLGWIKYHGSGRTMFLLRPQATPQMRQRLDEMLRRYETQQLERVELIHNYANAGECRHGMIAAHFGGAAVAGCGICDVCAPDRSAVATKSRPAASVPADQGVSMTILKAVASVPYPLGKTGLTRLLRGSIASSLRRDRCRYYGALSGETRSRIEDSISHLISEGYLNREKGEYPVLALTSKVRSLLSNRKQD